MTHVTEPNSPVPASHPPEAWLPLVRFARFAGRPLERFLHTEATSGVLLMLAAASALVLANSPFAESYAHFWHTTVGVKVGSFAFERSLEWVINDGLMVLFFFVVGMEIRREIHQGELSEWRRAALPVAAALGGMLAPAGLYLLLANAPEARSGWGVPMATDIAFAVGVLTLLGKRVPAALRVLLLALAVIDDLGAIVVIAVFYSSHITLLGFGVAAVGLLGVLLMQRLGVRSKLLYVVPSLVAWAGIYSAGVHPTIAGVVIGLMTPVQAWLGTEGFIANTSEQLETLAQAPHPLPPQEVATALSQVNVARREALSPAESLIASLHPWVAFVIMPVFALANAGVSLVNVGLDQSSAWIAMGVGIGLVVGKPVGILVACWMSIRLRFATLPAGVTFRHLVILGVVAGIGFTMSLFIAQLAFDEVVHLAAAKLGVLLASGLAGVLAMVLGRLLLSEETSGKVATTADEAESSTEL